MKARDAKKARIWRIRSARWRRAVGRYGSPEEAAAARFQSGARGFLDRRRQVRRDASARLLQERWKLSRTKSAFYGYAAERRESLVSGTV